jgi:hypothetical protein
MLNVAHVFAVKISHALSGLNTVPDRCSIHHDAPGKGSLKTWVHTKVWRSL